MFPPGLTFWATRIWYPMFCPLLTDNTKQLGLRRCNFYSTRRTKIKLFLCDPIMGVSNRSEFCEATAIHNHQLTIMHSLISAVACLTSANILINALSAARCIHDRWDCCKMAILIV